MVLLWCYLRSNAHLSVRHKPIELWFRASELAREKKRREPISGTVLVWVSLEAGLRHGLTWKTWRWFQETVWEWGNAAGRRRSRSRVLLSTLPPRVAEAGPQRGAPGNGVGTCPEFHQHGRGLRYLSPLPRCHSGLLPGGGSSSFLLAHTQCYSVKGAIQAKRCWQWKVRTVFAEMVWTRGCGWHGRCRPRHSWTHRVECMGQRTGRVTSYLWSFVKR